jgi:hypothetical protein
MSAFDDWDNKPRDKSVPMNLAGLREEAFYAGMERAAVMLDQYPYVPRSSRSREADFESAAKEYAEAIRKEIE